MARRRAAPICYPGSPGSCAVAWRSVWRLRRSPFTTKEAVRQLFEYHRRGFHPNDRDTTEMIANWREKLFGSGGELVELLAA